MKKQKDNHIAFTLSGIQPPEELKLNKNEIAILKKAMIICSKADSYFNEEENDFSWAEIYLRHITEDTYIIKENTG